MSGGGREALPDVREWSVDSPECPRPLHMLGVVERPYRMSGCGREIFPNIRE